MLGKDDIGHRVTLRRFIGLHDGRPVYTDTIGQLTAADESHITIRTVHGFVEVALVDVRAARRVPDQRARSATERLELVAARGWPASDSERLGDWLLRAAQGWSNRANSALPIGDPGCVLPAAVDAVSAWYTARDLRPSIAVPRPIGGRVSRELDRRGWTTSPEVLVQTAPVPTGELTAPRPGTVLRLDRVPPAAWFTAVRDRRGDLPTVARQILTASARPLSTAGGQVTADLDVVLAGVYASDGTAIATARGVVTEGWLGLSTLGVAEPYRRQGWARWITAAVAKWALDRGAIRAYLQVEAHNEAAVAMYSTLGFRTAHSYVYRKAP